MHFAVPALLYGLLAAATPFLIHWFLRPRPRRVIFPAVSLMKPALASGRRAQRMRDLWLLAVRAALLGLLAFLLAGPSCSSAAAQPEASQPIAAALVIDDSWSVRYRLDADATLMDRCRERAIAEVQSALAWPQPSALGVWFASAASAPQELTGDFAAARERIKAEASAAPHAQPLGAAIRAAAQRLAGARQPVRRLVVVSDGAAHAWRDVPPGVLTGIGSVSVRIVTPEIERRTNLALTDVRGPQRMHPETMPIPLRISVRAAGLETRCTLVVREGPRTLLRHGPVEVAPDATRDITLLVAPLPRGPHGLSVTVEPADRLDFDQSRFVAIQCGKRPVAWLIAPPADAADEDLSETLYVNLLAPEALESRWQIVALKRPTPESLSAEIAAAAGDAVPELIVVTAGTRLGDAARAGVTRLVEGGATLLLACSSRAGASDWPGLRPWIARSAPLVQTLAAPTTLVWESSTTLPMNDEGLDELKRATVSRRLQWNELADGVVVHARFSDGAPAIVSSRVGRGHVFALATSPDPLWSEWGTRAAGLLTLLHELVQRAAPPPDAIASLTAGESSRFPLPRETAGDVATVVDQSSGDAKPFEVKLADGRPPDSWPTDSAGIFAIRAAAANPPDALYAVNWPVEESDLAPIHLERLRALLGVADVSFAENASQSAAALSWPQRLGLRDPADVFLAILLALLIGEMLLAARKKPRAGYATDAGS